ncbi:hypothetical protein [Streptomyces sp. NPDC097981]|uniref:hypothetical protein n=1 Tax=Streptomyces sp. NPDC097981 TaxID=3155428 RepID=UPI0033297077
MNGPIRPALVGALVVSLAGLFPAAHAVAAPPAASTCTITAGPKEGTVTLHVSGFRGDLRVTETSGKYNKIIHKGTSEIPGLPEGSYTVEWSNATTPDENQHTVCTGETGTSTDQNENQYRRGFQQGLKDTLEACKKNQPQHLTQPNPDWQAGYDKGAETALNSKRCAA